jgi:Ca-activated chloride channel family protein
MGRTAGNQSGDLENRAGRRTASVHPLTRSPDHLIIHLAILLVLLSTASWSFGDAGVIIPTGQERPNPSILSLEEMHLTVFIDNGDARVFIQQIYGSHSSGVLEGNYIFALPSRAAISDFAVWDGVTRIPGVILERKRAEEIYNALKWQAIDPGLLQMGERGAEEARRSQVFSAHIVPIPAFGTKRLELEYHETLPVENLESLFAVPLHPDAYQAQSAAHLTIDFELHSQHPIRDFQVIGQTFPLKITEREPTLVKATLEGGNVLFKEDFAVRYALDEGKADSLEVLTYRNPRPQQPDAADTTAPAANVREPGFFEASALFASSGRAPSTAGPAPAGPPRTILVLFDTSLSMQWEKLERSYRAMETLLRSLRPADRFNLLLFNTELSWFEKQPSTADNPTVERALEFVRASGLRGGTNLQQALAAALAQAKSSAGESYIVLLSDGDATRGLIGSGRLAAWYSQEWKSLPDPSRPRTYVFGVGDDANQVLLRLLGQNRGLMEWVRSTEPMDFKLHAFIGKIGRDPLSQLQLTSMPAANFDLVYPLEDTVFPGSVAAWVGQYKRPLPSAQFDVRAIRAGAVAKMHARVPLPQENLEHPDLPRTWAKARVDALLAKIEREGEDRASVDEIIRLARKYKFVTPYTSFLAAPRALLRPRVIRPGDPVIRVKTDPAIVSVVALFPFGLIKNLRYLAGEDIWQTRFLAPEDMTDGTYIVRLILRDREGHVYRESKTFVIVTQPPVVRVRLDKKQFRRGESVPLRVSASARTRTVLARMYGAEPAYLTWNQDAGANTGNLLIPADLPAGPYTLTVTAEDIAHNIGSQEVAIEVLP